MLSWVKPQAPATLQLFMGPSPQVRIGRPLSGTGPVSIHLLSTGLLQFSGLEARGGCHAKALGSLVASRATWDLYDFTTGLRSHPTLGPHLWPQWVWHMGSLAQEHIKALSKPLPRKATGGSFGKFTMKVKASRRLSLLPDCSIDLALLKYYYAGRRHFANLPSPTTMSYSCDFTRMSKRGCGTGIVGCPTNEVFWCPPQVLRLMARTSDPMLVLCITMPCSSA